jgi:hypothetical protein
MYGKLAENYVWPSFFPGTDKIFLKGGTNITERAAKDRTIERKKNDGEMVFWVKCETQKTRMRHLYLFVEEKLDAKLLWCN